MKERRGNEQDHVAAVSEAEAIFAESKTYTVRLHPDIARRVGFIIHQESLLLRNDAYPSSDCDHVEDLAKKINHAVDMQTTFRKETREEDINISLSEDDVNIICFTLVTRYDSAFDEQVKRDFIELAAMVDDAFVEAGGPMNDSYSYFIDREYYKLHPAA